MRFLLVVYTPHGMTKVGLLFAVAALAGCPSKSDKNKASLPPCTAFGQNCELEPGKLGTCVFREGCSEGNCFVCQSQH